MKSLLFPSSPPSLRKLEVGVSPIHPAYLLRLTPASGTSGVHSFFDLSLSNYPAMAFSIVVYSAHLCNLHESILIAGFATLRRIFIYCALVILHYCTLSEGFSAVAELDDGFRARPGSRAPILGRAVAGLYHLAGLFRGVLLVTYSTALGQSMFFISSPNKYTMVRTNSQRRRQYLTSR